MSRAAAREIFAVFGGKFPVCDNRPCVLRCAERIGQTPVELVAVHEDHDAARFFNDMPFQLAFGIVSAGKARGGRAAGGDDEREVDVDVVDEAQRLHAGDGEIVVIDDASDEIDHNALLFRKLERDMRTCRGDGDLHIGQDRRKPQCRRAGIEKDRTALGGDLAAASAILDFPSGFSKSRLPNSSSMEVLMNFMDFAPPRTLISSPFSSRRLMSRRSVMLVTSGNMLSSSERETNGFSASRSRIRFRLFSGIRTSFRRRPRWETADM